MRPAFVLWFTGLSGAGKTTIAEGAKSLLLAANHDVLMLDGDLVRAKRKVSLGFIPSDIRKNNTEIAEFCVEQQNNYDVILVPIISPYAASRQNARHKIGARFFEIYCDADLDCVSRRDVKGLYAKARRGEIDNLIGVNSANIYEPPENPDFVIGSGAECVEESVLGLFNFIQSLHRQMIEK